MLVLSHKRSYERTSPNKDTIIQQILIQANTKSLVKRS